jgi:hypothetical protein
MHNDVDDKGDGVELSAAATMHLVGWDPDGFRRRENDSDERISSGDLPVD